MVPLPLGRILVPVGNLFKYITVHENVLLYRINSRNICKKKYPVIFFIQWLVFHLSLVTSVDLSLLGQQQQLENRPSLPKVVGE